jgi:cellulose synthase/poly-beta-1,6-N-acetylglucosamine synthase-like glycosyltransferase
MLRTISGFMYTVVVLCLYVYAVHLIILLILFLLHKSDSEPSLPDFPRTAVPGVLVQIPLRNERFVVTDILRHVAQLDWPDGKLHIQVLDDSSDDTYDKAIAEVVKLQKSGFSISLIHRKAMDGYKAGALATGLTYHNCDYVAIFDADFTPNSHFLKRTIPYLINDPELAMVQTRWSYVNASSSRITRCQAIILDAHFVIDHIARNRSNLMMNFNGTAGVWRRKAIDRAGGWDKDMLAEDLDLSYRAQLKGLKCLYLPKVVSLSQLPGSIPAFIQQQNRWAKGAAQTFRKLWRRIIVSHFSLGKKMMALLHLGGYVTQLLYVLLILLSIPMTILHPSSPAYVQYSGVLFIVPLLYYAVGQTEPDLHGLKNLVYYPLLALLAVGCSISVSSSFMDGLLHRGGEFIRTPKFANNSNKQSRHPIYVENTGRYAWLTSIFVIYILLSLFTAYIHGNTRYVFPGLLFLLARLYYLLEYPIDKIRTRKA